MSILTDKEIIELCTPPSFITITNVPTPSTPGSMVFQYPRPVESYSRMSAAEIEEQIKNNLLTHGYHQDPMRAIGIVSYRELTEEEKAAFRPMISPFSPVSVKQTPTGKKIPSWGSSSYGYDIRIGRNFKLFKKPCENSSVVIDICDFAKTEKEIIEDYIDVDFIEIPPHGFALGHSLEHINMPPMITAICMGKSTIARNGLHMCITPLECGWSGYITVELENMTDYPIRLHSGIGISQLLFLKGDENCLISYADRGGKYQNQPPQPITPKL